MKIATLDFESFWDTDFSLSKLTPLQYVMDKRFELISVALKLDGSETNVFFGEAQIRRELGRLDWAQLAALGHNMSGFDAYILAYRLGINPRLFLCTLAMARPLHAKTVGLGLGKLVAHYAGELRKMGINPVKDNSVLLNTKGRRLADFTADERNRMRVYNRDDTDQCYGLFQILRKHFNAAELWQIDALVRMRTQPQFELDFPLLEVAASIERVRKHKALLDLAKTLREQIGLGEEDDNLNWSDEVAVTEFVRAQLASAPKFSEVLTRLGVDVPLKPSPTDPTKQVPALAKTDEEFIALQEHEDDMVAAAARARLDVKSTLLETRIEKFMTAGRLAGGFLPIPLKFCGADTTGRDSGEEYNPQNQPRIDKKKPKPSDALRRSQRAPKGKVVIVADQSGIELRINHTLWKVPSSMALFQANPAKADLYREFAARHLFKVAPEEIDPGQRQVGKVAQLGLGFGAGALTFQRIARVQGGIDMPLTKPTLPEHMYDEEGFLRPEFQAEFDALPMSATDVVAAWRAAYPEITGGWKTCGAALEWIAQGREVEIDPWGLMHTCREGVVLPSGRLIRYPNLRQEPDGKWPDGRAKTSWFYADGRHKARITGPKADENDVQALARDSVFDCALEFFRDTGLRPANRVHDELIYVVDEGPAPELLAHLQSLLRKPPKWWPQLVTWSEGGIGATYGDAK